uniref:WRKY19-like zinc finger domain-containing protein n=1 Tax=Timema monikensis TaxID=170555 RepID=A0A7R9EA56_9NEOP|nr:unnamed protein product [Timema monikensis]
MEDSFTNEAQQISETIIKQEIDSEHEAEMHPPEFVNMAIKTEIPESCESESLEDNHEVCYEKASLVNDPIKKEVSDHDSNDMITGLPSCSLPPIFEDIKMDVEETKIPHTSEDSNIPVQKTNSPDTIPIYLLLLKRKNNIPKRYEAPLVYKYRQNDDQRSALENAPEKSGSESAPRENARECKTEGCHKFAKNGGHCISHGGNSKTCEVEGCIKYPLKGGRCNAHGGNYNHLKCRTEGCSKYAMKGGHCKPHGGCSKECKVEGCTKYPLKGGLCKAHGGQVHDCLKCKSEGCDKLTQRGGYCVAHGGSSKKCGTEGCTRIARKGGHCNIHGGTRIRYQCKTEGCSKWAQKGGHCISHGGISKTCKVEGCDNHPLKGGVCRIHGGTFYGRSKCKAEGCSKHALVGGYCKPHGGSSHKCKTEGCYKYPLKVSRKIITAKRKVVPIARGREVIADSTEVALLTMGNAGRTGALNVLSKAGTAESTAGPPAVKVSASCSLPTIQVDRKGTILLNLYNATAPITACNPFVRAMLIPTLNSSAPSIKFAIGMLSLSISPKTFGRSWGPSWF